MADPLVAVGDAAFILEKAGPLLDKMEQDAVEAAIAAKWQDEKGAQDAKRALERVSVIRDFRGSLESVLRLQQTRDKREEQGRTVA
jgi:hypothetical protein